MRSPLLLALLAGCGRVGFDGSVDRVCPGFTEELGLPSTYLLVTEPTSWANARFRCFAQGGDLAFPSDGEEAAVLAGMLEREGLTQTWIGVHDLEIEDAWTTVDEQPQTFLPWNAPSNEPNGGTNENCVRMNVNGAFVDVGCSNMHEYICGCEP